MPPASAEGVFAMKNLWSGVAASILMVFALAPPAFARSAAATSNSRIAAQSEPSGVTDQAIVIAQQRADVRSDQRDTEQQNADKPDDDGSGDTDNQDADADQNGDADNGSDPDQNAQANDNGDNAGQDNDKAADSQADNGDADDQSADNAPTTL
jgi:hypothetical protein